MKVATNMKPSKNDDPYLSVVESLMRISLAGFGGALTGLSLSRRGGLAAASSAASRTVRTVSTRTKSGNHSSVVRTAPPSTRPYVDGELPVTWAMACIAFAGVVEFTSLISPSSLFMGLIPKHQAPGNRNPEDINPGDINPEDMNPEDINPEDINPEDPSPYLSPEIATAMQTTADYALGGAIAGALFRGAAIRTRVGARLELSLLGTSLRSARGSPLVGMIPGAALGFLAGTSIVALDYAQAVANDQFGHGKA